MRDIPLSDEDKWAIYDQLLHITTRDEFPSPNVTVVEYAARYNLKRATASNKLEALCAKGIMKKAPNVKVGSHSCNIYWLASLESDDTPPATHE